MVTITSVNQTRQPGVSNVRSDVSSLTDPPYISKWETPRRLLERLHRGIPAQLSRSRWNSHGASTGGMDDQLASFVLSFTLQGRMCFGLNSRQSRWPASSSRLRGVFGPCIHRTAHTFILWSSHTHQEPLFQPHWEHSIMPCATLLCVCHLIW